MLAAGAEQFFGWSSLTDVVLAVSRILNASYADDLAHVVGCAAGQVPKAIKDIGSILWEVFASGVFRVN